MMLLKQLALLLYSGQLVLGGWQQWREPTPRADRARAIGWTVPDELVRASGWAMIAAAVGLQLPALRRPAALGVALQLVPITWVGHRFWEHTGPQQAQHQIHFFKNVSMIGAALYIAATAD